jgi:hypothetical protein
VVSEVHETERNALDPLGQVENDGVNARTSDFAESMSGPIFGKFFES